MEKQFSIRESLKSGWSLIKGENLFLLIGLFIGYLVVYGILSSVRVFMPGGIVALVAMLAEIFLSLVWAMGIVKILLQISNGEEPEFTAFKDVLPLFWRYLGTSILKGLPAVVLISAFFIYFIVKLVVGMHIDVALLHDNAYVGAVLGESGLWKDILLGLFVVMIPVIYLEIRWMFFTYLIVDKNSGAIESLKQSWKMTNGNFWHLFLFGLTCFGLYILGLMALILGVFVVIPLVMIAQALIYKKLVAKLTVEQEVEASVVE